MFPSIFRGAVSANALVLAASLAVPAALAQTGPSDDQRQTADIVIVTAAANPEDPPVVAEARQRLSETPGAVAVVSSESYANRYAPGLSDVLRDVPGVFVQKKWGGDTRLSIRGSGIGNANHLRGTLVAQDGIPMNEADGFGDTQMVDPSLARYTEVYKGGNALRYGGALLGGAINIVTPTGRTMPSGLLFKADVGSYGQLRGHAEAGGVMGAWDGFAAVTGMTADGWRAQAQGQQQYGSGNVGYSFGDDREVRAYLSGGYIHQQIPGSLSLNDALNRPKIANPTNVTNNYQRDQRVMRGVVQTRWRMDDSTVVEGGVFATWKDLDHPIFQVIDQESRNWGLFGRVDWEGQLFGKSADAFYGVYYRSGDLDANQWINLAGSKGALTARSRQNANGVDVFAEGRLWLTESFALAVGGSYGIAERDFQSYAPSATVVQASQDYDWLSPRIGLIWQNAEGHQVYANVTRSVEPPNFGALSPTPGGFQPVRPQDATTFEIGARGRGGAFIWDVSAYYADIEDELLSFTTNAGQGIPASTFNAQDGTVHQGVEAGLDWQIADFARLRQTYTWSDFHFTGDRQYGDNRLPIVPEHVYRAELRLDAGNGFWVGPSVEAASSPYVDFANELKAPSYTIFNLGAGWRGDNGVSAYVDVRNLTDERYVSNVTAITDPTPPSGAPPSLLVFYPGDGLSIFGGITVGF